jgi:excisionase family DNA binding protein
MRPADYQLVTPGDAAKLLATTAKALDHRRRNGEIRFIRIGRLVRYSLADIERYIAEHTVTIAPRRRGRPHKTIALVPKEVKA